MLSTIIGLNVFLYFTLYRKSLSTERKNHHKVILSNKAFERNQVYMSNKRNKSNMNKHRGKAPQKYFTLKGEAQLSGSITATSAGGSFVSTRYEIDTPLCLSWQQAGQLFARWRVKRVTFGFRAIKGTTTDGNVGIVFLPDTNMTTPTTTANALSNERAAFGHIYQNLRLVVKPKHEGWLFTRDAVGATDDRLEMPGDIVIWTENCSSSFTPGIFMMQYEVEFDQISNSTVAPVYPIPKEIISKDENKETCSTQPKVETISKEVLDLAKRIHVMRSTNNNGKET